MNPARAGLIAWVAFFACCLAIVEGSIAKPIHEELGAPLARRSPPHTAARLGKEPAARVAVQDTAWLVDWSFGDATCDPSGWQAFDLRILNDGSNYWHMGADFDMTGGIVGTAAILSKHDLCWESPDGYDNDWDYAIVCEYTGVGATLSFEYLVDSEEGFDFLTVEADSACSSNDRVDYAADPTGTPARLRQTLFADSGLNTGGSVVNLALPDFGAPADTHCVYIRFGSDVAFSPADGLQLTTLGVAVVVDQIVVTGGLAYSEDFDAPMPGPHVQLINSAPGEPFGLWARLYPDPNDNDPCAEGSGCSWIFSDPTLPASTPDMAFGPGGAVVRNWLDNAIVSPWIATTAPQPGRTFLEARYFPGNSFSASRIVLGTELRFRRRIPNTDTGAEGDSLDCATPWGRNWASLSQFSWRTLLRSYTTPADANAVQVRFRVSDWQMINSAEPPATPDPGPGPYIDRVRIGREFHTGPALDPFPGAVAQDNFPTELVSATAGENYRPTTDRFGTSDFAQVRRNISGSSGPGGIVWTITTRDSLVMEVTDVLGTGGISTVQLHGAIVAGPHAGKAPPPASVGANGFFSVSAALVPGETDHWFVDLDDDYFRGGDQLVYFWTATDAGGNLGSFPDGLTALPASVDEAQDATGGLLVVDFLPRIDWDQAYLDRIAADSHGKLEPTVEEIQGSAQHGCILYEYIYHDPRRTGDINRTAFMYTLDQLGYRDLYDVYYQNTDRGSTTNNPIASRATVEQVTGYAAIVLDAGPYADFAIADGSGVEQLTDQNQWYRDWLAQAASGEAGRATLWVLGDDIAEAWLPSANHILGDEMGVVLAGDEHNLGPRPEVVGQGAFSWAHGSTSDFSDDAFVLTNPFCNFQEGYDALGATAPAVVTHRFAMGATTGDGAVVMNANAGAAWNAVTMSFSWEDIRESGDPPIDSESALAGAILEGVLPPACLAQRDTTTDALDRDPLDDGLPRVAALYANAPNPFNPVTTIAFDLPQEEHVQLRIYDVSGRLVRTLVDHRLERRHHRAVWDGLDDSGQRVASGLYVYRLKAGTFRDSRKMVVLR